MILMSAGTAARRRSMQERAQQLGGALNWSRLAELLGVRRLLTTLGPRILELAGGHASEEFEIGVAGALESGRRQGAFLQLIGARVMGALGDAGIRSTALKGPILSEALYGDPGRRLSSDIDLLVAPEQLYAAVDAVRELGYAAPNDNVGDRGLPLLHFALVHERGELPPVELHWRIHWYESRFARDRLLVPDEDPGRGWRPAPVDELTALLLFYARDGFISLRHAADLGAWWDTFGAAVQQGALGESIRAYPALEPVVSAGLRVAQRTVGLPAGQLADRGAKLGVRGRIAVRLADPYRHSRESQLYADMGLIDGLLAPRGGFRAFVKRQVAPGTQGGQAGLALGYSARVLVRYGLAMTRLLRLPRTASSR